MTTTRLWEPDQYQLLDFGGARKLERFGTVVLDRPSPAAERARRRSPELWQRADLRLDDKGRIESANREPPADWRVGYGAVTMQLRLTPFGHVGLFPEHALNWAWLSQRYAHLRQLQPGAPIRVLNLFAYTGGASLVSAAVGCEVVHVDSSAPSVAWARTSAELCGLSGAPIRWIVDDARTFVAREVRRGRRYEAIILDPPSYGHGPKGKSWIIERDLPQLLGECCELLAGNGSSLVLTGHSESLSGESIDFRLPLSATGHRPHLVETGRLTLCDSAERALDSGWYARLTIGCA